jgi:hypothetical protein
VRFNAAGLRALRFTAAFRNPENIRVVYVDAYGAGRRRVARGLWRARGHARPGVEPELFVLVPGEPTAFFRSEGYADQAIAEIHVFIRVTPGTEAGFVLRDVAVATGPATQPGVSADGLPSARINGTDADAPSPP